MCSGFCWAELSFLKVCCDPVSQCDQSFKQQNFFLIILEPSSFQREFYSWREVDSLHSYGMHFAVFFRKEDK
jgi:hypothetical protein